MLTTYSNPGFEAHPENKLHSILIEPFLVLGVFAFWVVTLPVAAVSMLGIKTWDAVIAFKHRAFRANPLILSRRTTLRKSVSLPPSNAATRKA
jgi:hypothetical protein